MSRPKSPLYYRAGEVDVADVVNAFQLDYWCGSVVAHVLRAGRKPGETRLQALENALACLQHAVTAELGRTAADGVKP